MSEKKFTPINTVLATIVLYNTSLEQSVTFKTLSASLKNLPGKLDILVYDNSPDPHPTDTHYDCWNIRYVHNPKNPGVSKAYNEGFHLARKLRKKWMLLLDQDTSFPSSAIAQYTSAISLPDITIAAPILKAGKLIISPFKHFHGYGKPTKNISPGRRSLNQWTAVNSGLLIQTDAFDQAGGYNESIRLDYSDISFFTRLKKHFREVLVLDMHCNHGFFGSSDKNEQQMIQRFKSYCNGAKMIYKETRDFMFLITAFVRVLKLTIKHRSLIYLKIFLSM